MSTEKIHTNVFVHVANCCGVTAAVLLGGAIAYHSLMLAEVTPPPPLGVTPLWTMAITLLTAVKVMQWLADRTVRVLNIAAEERNDRLIALIETNRQAVMAEVGAQNQAVMYELARVSDAALNSARSSGRWEGVANILKDAEQENTGDLLQMSRSRRPS